MKKILAVVTCVLLCVLLFIFFNSWIGNPVSGSLAKKAAKQYIDTKYRDLKLQIKRSNYNFKESAYCVFVQSTESEDTAFMVYVNQYGTVMRDDYEYEVANNFTTWRRLDEEMRELAKVIVGERLEYDIEGIYISFEKESDIMVLERDMILDIQHPPLPLVIDITIFHEDVSYQTIAKVAKAMETILKEQKIPIDKYSVRVIPMSDKPEDEAEAFSWVNSLSVSDFPANKMNAENLHEVMEQFETERVSEYNEKTVK